jgi:hypothetical protein
MKRYLLGISVLFTLGLSACGGSSSPTGPTHSPDTQGGPGNAANKSIDGKWSIKSKTCSGQNAPVPDSDWVKFDSDGTFLAYVSTAENDDTHLCLHVDAYMINMMSAGQATSDGTTTYTEMAGLIRKSAIRDMCRRKINGEVQRDTYIDKSANVNENSTIDVRIRHEANGNLIVSTAHPAFCSGAPAVLLLSPLQ